MEYGLIGKKLGHSFSKEIHESFGYYTYTLTEIAEENVEAFFQNKAFKAINITIPYKQIAYRYADVLDPAIQDLGAINCLVNKEGVLYGYNTDYDGIAATFEKKGIDLKHKKVAILGVGGVSKAFAHYCRQNQAAQILFVYYKEKPGTISYEELRTNHSDIEILINATPIGMYPHVDESPMSLHGFAHLEFVFDAIYNPLETKLLYEAKQRKIPCSNGLYMLVVQAKVAAEYFLDRPLDSQWIDAIWLDLMQRFVNIALIGMPSCGKSTIASLLQQRTNRKLVEMDEQIVEIANKSISLIFEQEGEEAFRHLESEVLKTAAAKQSQILSCGGGIIKKPKNVEWLQKNSIILYICRNLDQLIQEDQSRPLLKEGIENLYRQRKEKYQQAADRIVENNAQLFETIAHIEKILAEKNTYQRFE